MKLDKKNSFFEINFSSMETTEEIMLAATFYLKSFLNKSKNKSLRLFIETLINYIGKNGTILIPTYNYDFTRGKTFQTSKSLSQVGELGNILMKIKSNNRTNEPVFSHLVIGKLKKKIFKFISKKIYSKWNSRARHGFYGWRLGFNRTSSSR